MVADALSRKERVKQITSSLMNEFDKLEIELVKSLQLKEKEKEESNKTLTRKVLESQMTSGEKEKMEKLMRMENNSDFHVNKEEIIFDRERMQILSDSSLKDDIE
ncbi:hypothetical protein AgCh_030964 [Apium graveolens]